MGRTRRPAGLIVCGVIAMRLVYRLASNLEKRGADDVPDPAWASWSFVTPVASFFAPPLLIGRLWRATFAARDNPRKGSAIIGFWWTAWIVSAILLWALTLLARGAGGALTQEMQLLREEMWAVGAAGYGGRFVCCFLFLAVLGPLVRGQTSAFDASTFD